MVLQSPKIDLRTAADIAQQLKALLAAYMPEHFPTPDAIASQGVQAALIAAFVRHAELIIQRLNQVPDKNLLAFLNLLGASQLPPQPARVPLTFFLSQGSTADATIPARTPVATAASNGQNPVVFETEQELTVTATQLVSVFTRDPFSDRYADYSAIIHAQNTAGIAALTANQAIEHSFYISNNALLSLPNIQTLRLSLQLKDSILNPDPRQIQWEIWDGQSGIPLTPLQDGTAGLTTNIFPETPAILFNALPPIPQTTLNALLPNRWLRCRLLTSITPNANPQPNAVRTHSQDPPVQQLPEIQSLQLQVQTGRLQLPIDAALSNQVTVDLKQPFFPFGEKPRFGDTLYLACQEGFAFAGSLVALAIDIADPATLGMIATKDSQNPDLKLQWEFWDGQIWKAIGISNRQGAVTNDNRFVDNTQALTKIGINVVQFILSGQPQALMINGVNNVWVRVRIIAGDYGKEAQYAQDSKTGNITSFKPASFVPPVINTLTAGYRLVAPDQPASPEQILTYNDFTYKSVASGAMFAPFQAVEDTAKTLYLGFQPPAHQTFPNRPLNLYFAIAEVLSGNDAPSTSLAQVRWEYWNGDRWITLTLQDETQSFSHSGLVEFLVPADFAPRQEFGIEQYWLRIVWQSASDTVMPQLQQIILNTTTATQSTTIQAEILGSSQSTASQVFRTAQAPVLTGQILEIRELEQPVAANLQPLNSPQPTAETWVEWQEVSDFYGSAAGDRHYTLNHLTGEITFGDGLNGRIPPLGANNLRIHYRAGGGAAGNSPIGSVVELKTTLPFIDRVSNPAPAAGGADAESLDTLKERAPRSVRHGGRAVTLEDYEDLAMLASPAVARVKCIPTRNLATAAAQTSLTVEPGCVSVILVPQSTELKPIPSVELVERVQAYLQANAMPTVSIIVIGPAYVQVSITAEVALQSLNNAKEIDLAIHQGLTCFLHPLVGGFDGTGWIFGREPHKSDLYALLEAIPGVDHIRTLTVIETEDFPNAKQSDRFLIYSGTHTVTYTLNN